MKLEYFIANRLATSKHHKSSISKPIIKIAIAAIAIGILMMIVAVATGIGLQQKIRQKVSAFNGHIIIKVFDDNQSEVSKVPISKDQEFYPKFKNVEGVKNIQVVATKAGIIRTENTFEGIVFKGISTDFNWENMKEYLIEGRKPKIDLATQENGEIIISQYLANRLLLKIGDKCNTFFMKEESGQSPNLRVFTIVGIFNSGFQEFDATYVIGDIRHIQRMNKWKADEVGAFEVFVHDFDKIQQVGNQVYNNTFNKKDPTKTVDTQIILDKYYYIFDWLKLFDFNIIVILTIMIIVATINMAVALLVLILERTQMIGILKALGANNWLIRKIFLYNAFYIIIRGLFWGNVIAITLIIIQDRFGIITLNPENYYVTVAPVYLNWGYILLLNLGTLLISLLVLIIPSYIISRVSPVKAIRFD
ncbi:ABC transporter permease [Flavobacterium orientale]|uniref:Permease n=1 Tax=Flavobacterium orientale TaxID=1756020 RepID=A0A917DA38_9FLAO|nr:FtsX-like permease family protein [Flavobacterium orientale]GGD20730.1 permease [Flavobacterium orientale]